jgi:hypothetical protein
LALQVQADPDLDIGPAFDLWESMVLLPGVAGR